LYTASNICLRAVVDYDPMWVQCVKEAPIVLLIGPWLLARWSRGQHVLPPARVLGILFLGALVTHFLGNTFFQWSLGIVGISLAVPILLGAIIVGGALLSRVFLGELVTARTAVAVTVLLIAMGLLGWAAHQRPPVSLDAHEADPVAEAPLPEGGWGKWTTVMGVGALLVAGCAFGNLGVVIRYGVKGSSPLSTTTVIVGAVGVIGLGTLSYLRLGWEVMAATSREGLAVMLVAGVCNATAFLLLTKALQLINVVHVNAIGSSQCALAALAGVFLFSEQPSLAMIAGVVLTAVGLSMMRPSSEQAGPPDQDAAADGRLPATPGSGGTAASETHTEG
jgi:drug/metabolite transporter (DMT)-like permease